MSAVAKVEDAVYNPEYAEGDAPEGWALIGVGGILTVGSTAPVVPHIHTFLHFRHTDGTTCAWDSNNPAQVWNVLGRTNVLGTLPPCSARDALQQVDAQWQSPGRWPITVHAVLDAYARLHSGMVARRTAYVLKPRDNKYDEVLRLVHMGVQEVAERSNQPDCATLQELRDLLDAYVVMVQGG